MYNLHIQSNFCLHDNIVVSNKCAHAEVDAEVDGVMQLRVIWLIGGQCVIFVLILAENCVFVASLDPITNSSMVFCFGFSWHRCTYQPNLKEIIKCLGCTGWLNMAPY